MNLFTYRISLDIRETTSQAFINVKKNDTARKFIFTLTDNGRAYQITEGCTAVFRAKKPDGTVLYNNCPIVGNAIEYSLTSQTVAAVGIVECEVTLYGSDSKQITSPRFALVVEDVLYSDSEVESENEFTELTQAISDTNNLDVTVSKANGVATITITKKDGTTVIAQISDGADGHSPVITATKSGKVTTVKVDGATIATINDGSDGASGAAGADGITPHIGANGNWYIGDIDTGKPSRGEKGEAGENYFSGSYNDLENKPIQQIAFTSSLNIDDFFGEVWQYGAGLFLLDFTNGYCRIDIHDSNGNSIYDRLYATGKKIIYVSKAYANGTYSEFYFHDINTGEDFNISGDSGSQATYSEYNNGFYSGNYYTKTEADNILSKKADKVDGKGLSTNDYTDAAKAKVDAIPSNPKYTDTVYDDTALKSRVSTIEGKEAAWDAKSDFSGSYNDLTNKPTIPTVPTNEINANTAARHTHSNKTVLDGITTEKVSKWDNPPTALKNPFALTVKIGDTEVVYDGSAAKTITIGDGTGVSY